MKITNKVKDYVTPQEIMDRLGLTTYSQFATKARTGQIKGAFRFNRIWAIPRTYLENELRKRNEYVEELREDDINLVSLEDYMPTVQVSELWNLNKGYFSELIRTKKIPTEYVVKLGNTYGIEKEYVQRIAEERSSMFTS